MDTVIIDAVRMDSTAILPDRATPYASCKDLCANENKVINPNEITVIGTGIKFAIPKGYDVRIFSRSGLAAKGIIVANGVGIVDSDYRGEVKVLLINASKKPFYVEKGMRLAQMSVTKIIPFEFNIVPEFGEQHETKRGTCGFGSTGLK